MSVSVPMLCCSSSVSTIASLSNSVGYGLNSGEFGAEPEVGDGARAAVEAGLGCSDTGLGVAAGVAGGAAGWAAAGGVAEEGVGVGTQGVAGAGAVSLSAWLASGEYTV